MSDPHGHHTVATPGQAARSDDLSLEDTRPLSAAQRNPWSPAMDLALWDTMILPAPLGALRRSGSHTHLQTPPEGFDIALQPTAVVPALKAGAAVYASANGSATGPSTVALVRGTLSLIMREGILKVVVLGANILLARLLAPQDFGVFTVLSFFIGFLSTFGAFGLAAAVVQRRPDPTRAELAALLTFQLVTGALFVAIAYLCAPALVAVYQLGPDGVWLIRVMAVSFLLASAGATPMALLERRLAFGRVAVIEVSAGLASQGLAVGLAFAGFGVWCLVAAALTSASLTTLVAFPLAGWRPTLSLRWRRILPMVGFGMRYQAVNILALIKDSARPTFVAAVLGTTALGYFGFAETLAFYPVILSSIVSRVMFPAFSRTADDRERLQQMVEAALRVQAYFSYPAVALLAAFAPWVTMVVFTAQWLPAVPLIRVLSISTVTATINVTLITALNALGKPHVALRFMVMWLIVLWTATLVLVPLLGLFGCALADAAVSVTLIVVIAAFRRHLPARVVGSLALPLLSAAVAGGASYALSQWEPPATLALLAGEAIAGLLAFIASELVLDMRFRRDVHAIVCMVFTRA